VKPVKGYQRNIALVVLVIMAFMVCGCGSPKNNTPVEGAKVFMKAMVNKDAKLMDQINHSGMLWPTQYLMEISNDKDWGEINLKDCQYEDKGKGTVEVTVAEDSIITLKMIEENGKWYFVKLGKW
jgi:hypothetical protein